MEQSQNSLERLKKSVDELIEVIHKQQADFAQKLKAEQDKTALESAKAEVLNADNAKLRSELAVAQDNSESEARLQQLQNEIENKEIANNFDISQSKSKKMTDEQLVNAISELLNNERQENSKINMDIVPNVELKYNINNNNQVQQNSINQQEMQNENMQLVVKEEDEFIQEKRMNIIKRFWKKIVNLFKSKNSTERIGE